MDNAQLSIYLHVGTANLSDHGYPKWLAVEERTGLFALADDEESAINRLRETVEFTLETLEEQEGADAVLGYLSSRNVRYVEVMDVQKTRNGALNLVSSHNPLDLAYASG